MNRVFGSFVLASLLACGKDEPLATAQGVDLARFQGKWHEVAHLPRLTQHDCAGTIATYTLEPEGKIKLVHECTLKDGAYHGSTALGSVPDPGDPAKMMVDFGGYVGEYWVLDVADDYRYALVGHPSREYLWVLSRTPTLSDADTKIVLDTAKSRGFDTGRLEYTDPAPEPTGTPAPPARYGCAAGGRSTTPGAWPLAGIALACAALAARRSRQDKVKMTASAPGVRRT